MMMMMMTLHSFGGSSMPAFRARGS